jgi:hypothetical protein
MLNKSSTQVNRYFTDKTFTIWLCLIGLTLISSSFIESTFSYAISTFCVCFIVMLKGRWIIDEFMGLKYSSPVIRKILKCYLYGMTTLVGLTFYYAQTMLIN